MRYETFGQPFALDVFFSLLCCIDSFSERAGFDFYVGVTLLCFALRGMAFGIGTNTVVNGQMSVGVDYHSMGVGITFLNSILKRCLRTEN